MRREFVWRDYVRFPRSERKIKSILTQAERDHCGARYIPLIGYWGVRPSGNVGSSERLSIQFLSHFSEVVGRELGSRLQFEFLITDTHAVSNGVGLGQIESYSAQIAALLSDCGLNSLMLSKIAPFSPAKSWAEAGERQITAGALVMWKRATPRLRRRLRLGAKRHVEGDVRLGLINYLAASRLDQHAVESNYPNSVFHSYNDPLFAPILPSLPLVCFWTLRSRESIKPWF